MSAAFSWSLQRSSLRKGQGSSTSRGLTISFVVATLNKIISAEIETFFYMPKRPFSLNIVPKSVKICVGEHFSFVEIISSQVWRIKMLSRQPRVATQKKKKATLKCAV